MGPLILSEATPTLDAIRPVISAVDPPVPYLGTDAAVRFRILYTFAGVERQCDLRAAVLAALGAAHGGWCNPWCGLE